MADQSEDFTPDRAIARTLQRAQRIVNDAGLPEALRPVAFGKVVELLLDDLVASGQEVA